MSTLRLILILFFLILIICMSIPIQIFCNIIGFKLKKLYPLIFYRMIKIVTGININFNSKKYNKKIEEYYILLIMYLGLTLFA